MTANEETIPQTTYPNELPWETRFGLLVPGDTVETPTQTLTVKQVMQPVIQGDETAVIFEEK